MIVLRTLLTHVHHCSGMLALTLPYHLLLHMHTTCMHTHTQALPTFCDALTVEETYWNEGVLQQCTLALQHIRAMQRRLAPLLAFADNWEQLVKDREEHTVLLKKPLDYSGIG